MTWPTASRAQGASVLIATRSAAETRDLAAGLASVAKAGDRIALIGPLGAGKTQFAKGFAKGLGVGDVVNSPSFTLMAEYEGRLPLFHQDLYRLSGADEAIAGGLVDERQAVGVTLTEWAERLPIEIDPRRVSVIIRVLGDDEREISISGAASSATPYTDAAKRWAAQKTRPGE